MITFLLIFGVGTLAALAVGGWVVLSGARTLWRFVTGEIGTASAGRPAPGDPRCPNGGCGTVNPAQARFCRRCGSTLGTKVPPPPTAFAPPRPDRLRSNAPTAVR